MRFRPIDNQVNFELAIPLARIPAALAELRAWLHSSECSHLPIHYPVIMRCTGGMFVSACCFCHCAVFGDSCVGPKSYVFTSWAYSVLEQNRPSPFSMI
jgi:hypothetical protein